ncbi:PhiRv1 Phage Protein [Mycobacterium canetti]|nr:PhiRv1 Phage Protein [Mycobacterium canetti]
MAPLAAGSRSWSSRKPNSGNGKAATVGGICKTVGTMEDGLAPA